MASYIVQGNNLNILIRMKFVNDNSLIRYSLSKCCYKSLRILAGFFNVVKCYVFYEKS